MTDLKSRLIQHKGKNPVFEECMKKGVSEVFLNTFAFRLENTPIQQAMMFDEAISGSNQYVDKKATRQRMKWSVVFLNELLASQPNSKMVEEWREAVTIMQPDNNI